MVPNNAKTIPHFAKISKLKGVTWVYKLKPNTITAPPNNMYKLLCADEMPNATLLAVNMVVVKEAAACGCPSLLIKESCAAENIIHEDTGILIEETVDSIANEIVKACLDLVRLKVIGENASDKIYLSWDDAVGIAFKRYHDVINEHALEKLNA